MFTIKLYFVTIKIARYKTMANNFCRNCWYPMSDNIICFVCNTKYVDESKNITNSQMEKKYICYERNNIGDTNDNL